MGERVRTKEKELENAGKALQLSIELQGKLGKANEGLRLAEGKLEEVEKQLREKTAEMLKSTKENKEKSEEIIKLESRLQAEITKLQAEITKLQAEIVKLDSKLQAEIANSVNLQAEIASKLSYFLPRDINQLQTQLKDLNQSSTQSHTQLEQAVALLNIEKTQLSESVSTLTQRLAQSEGLCQSLRE